MNYDFVVPEEVTRAARTVLRWASDNSLKDWRVCGIGPMPTISGTTGYSAQQNVQMQNLPTMPMGEAVVGLAQNLAFARDDARRLFYENVRLKAQIAELRRPLWQKVVAWLARFG